MDAEFTLALATYLSCLGGVATSFVVCTLVTFPLLDAMDVHYTMNLAMGIVLGATVNFLINDQFVFGGARAVVVPIEDTGARR